MGILDDAIREHLELKRRHGATEEELRQQEVEALGSPRRDAPEEDPDAAAATELIDDEAPLDVAADTADGNGVALAAEEVAEPDAHGGVPEQELEHEPVEEPEEPEVSGELDVPDDLDLPSAPEPEDPADTTSAFEEAPPPGGDTPPRGVEALEEAEEVHGEPEPADEADQDVLEDTPDFLQETPEHDRLWFEQKPPRDFDFE